TTQEKIFAFLQTHPAITRRELAVKIGITEDGIKYHLNQLKLSGRVRHVGPTKAGQWETLK
ncbi:MAG: winged helix-turn-helix transcriptional regulator, partial [Elusimicrobiota bacterium]|nr:winged helix-turn-helix transcriptional regulator [Elusimicrobiota bacterium]